MAKSKAAASKAKKPADSMYTGVDPTIARALRHLDQATEPIGELVKTTIFDAAYGKRLGAALEQIYAAKGNLDPGHIPRDTGFPLR